MRRENILMCDTKGVIYKGRKEGMNSYKERFAAETEARTLADAFVGADVFFGLSSGNCVTAEMLLTMAHDPIIFALANPDPEIALRRGRGHPSGCHRGYGAVRFSQPGEQRSGISVHLPRRARRARHHGERRNETGGHARPGGAGARRRAG